MKKVAILIKYLFLIRYIFSRYKCFLNAYKWMQNNIVQRYIKKFEAHLLLKFSRIIFFFFEL